MKRKKQLSTVTPIMFASFERDYDGSFVICYTIFEICAYHHITLEPGFALSQPSILVRSRCSCFRNRSCKIWTPSPSFFSSEIPQTVLSSRQLNVFSLPWMTMLSTVQKKNLPETRRKKNLFASESCYLSFRPLVRNKVKEKNSASDLWQKTDQKL